MILKKYMYYMCPMIICVGPSANSWYQQFFVCCVLCKRTHFLGVYLSYPFILFQTLQKICLLTSTVEPRLSERQSSKTSIIQMGLRQSRDHTRVVMHGRVLCWRSIKWCVIVVVAASSTVTVYWPETRHIKSASTIMALVEELWVRKSKWG